LVKLQNGVPAGRALGEDLRDGGGESSAGLPGPVLSGVRLSPHPKDLVAGLHVAASVGA
jgi:hypothetical protein